MREMGKTTGSFEKVMKNQWNAHLIENDEEMKEAREKERKREISEHDKVGGP